MKSFEYPLELYVEFLPVIALTFPNAVVGPHGTHVETLHHGVLAC
jgi:hypothetical protein